VQSVLSKGDVLKVDFGVHVKGQIIDSAFTITWEPTYEKLLEAVKAATDTGIRVSCELSPIFWICKHKIVSGSWNRCSVRRDRRSHPRDHGIIRGGSEWEGLPRFVQHLLFNAEKTQSSYLLKIVKALENLSSHSINLYRIHNDKLIPLVNNNDQMKMEEGE
jgi:methionyl aminopeptidase